MAANEQIILTPEGKRELEEEREMLRTKNLPRLRARVHALNEAGNVSDDSDFEETKEELVQLEARIREIEHILSDAKIVEHEDSYSVVEFGSSVRVADKSGQEDTWTIVSAFEASLSQGRISVESPMGSAMIGKQVGDSFTVVAPGGELEFEVKEIY